MTELQLQLAYYEKERENLSGHFPFNMFIIIIISERGKGAGTETSVLTLCQGLCQILCLDYLT